MLIFHLGQNLKLDKFKFMFLFRENCFQMFRIKMEISRKQTLCLTIRDGEYHKSSKGASVVQFKRTQTMKNSKKNQKNRS